MLANRGQFDCLKREMVLSTMVPANDPTITEQMWIDAVRPHFKGPVIVGRDLLAI
jgi:hypothetical protein